MIHALATSVVLALAGVSAPPAAPTPEYLLVSDDGVNYSTVSTFTLFADAGRVVPGDTITDQVWIKNSSSQAGRLRIDLTNARADDANLAAAVSIAVDPGDGSVTLADALANGNCTVVSSDLVLQPGESVRVEGSVSVDADLGSREGQTGREGHLATIGFQLRGIMIDAAVPTSSLPDNVCTTTPEAIATPDTSHLPATGASADPLLLALAGGAVGLGVLLAVAARRRTQRED